MFFDAVLKENNVIHSLEAQQTSEYQLTSTEADHFASIIQHLRDDIATRYRSNEQLGLHDVQKAVQLPSDWLITCIVRSLYHASMRNRPWEETVYRLLMHIVSFTRSEEGKEQLYFTPELQEKRHPNTLYFSADAMSRFAKVAIVELRQATSQSAIWKM